MDVDAFDHFDLQPRGVDMVDVFFDLLFAPERAGGLVDEAHEAGAARYLFYVFQRYAVVFLAVPPEGHFHCALPPFFTFSFTLLLFHCRRLGVERLSHGSRPRDHALEVSGDAVGEAGPKEVCAEDAFA
ncbi:hypothetical protein SDC9_95002 [bioreactor metagenome]|uniref:Uncharacterized protein n=1 Tax=bioreactor metagenome TaxID=1076179 RepID=A0A645A6D7_9ZZZZ